MPTVLLPAADPKYDATVAAVPALTTSPEYVYLSRVVRLPITPKPKAKMPNVPSSTKFGGHRPCPTA